MPPNAVVKNSYRRKARIESLPTVSHMYLEPFVAFLSLRSLANLGVGLDDAVGRTRIRVN